MGRDAGGMRAGCGWSGRVQGARAAWRSTHARGTQGTLTSTKLCAAPTTRSCLASATALPGERHDGGTTRRGAAGVQSLNAAEASESSGRVAPSKVVVMGHTARSLSGDVIAVTGAACVTLPAQLVDARRSRRIIMVPRSTDRRTTSAIGEPRCNGHSGGSGVCQYIDEILQRTQRGLCQTPGGSVPPCSRQIFVWLGIGLDFQYQARQIIG